MFQMQATKIENRSKEQAFTLIEVLIAMFILSIGLLAVAGMQISALRANTKAIHTTEHVVSAKHKLEQLIALPYNSPWLEAAGNPPATDTDGNTHQDTTLEWYTISWDVIDNDPVSNSKRITVTVTGGGGTIQVVSIKSS